MPETPTQNYSNYTRWDPLFHFFIEPVFLVTVIVAIVHAIRWPGFHTWWTVLLSIAALMLVFKARLYALKVQDRVIRLEERLRLTTLLPEALRNRIGELSESQLIALRFASDEELPALVNETLTRNLAPKEIKQAVKNWRADFFRV
ncbi:MAG TPA: DUF6526 family protein [Terriglobales bacterium]